MIRQYESLWKTNSKKIRANGGKRLKDSYFRGVTKTVECKIRKEITGNEQGIIPLNKDVSLDEFIKKTMKPKLRYCGKNGADRNATEQGMKDGYAIQIHNAIEKSNIKTNQLMN